MEKQSGKKKIQAEEKSADSISKQIKNGDNSPKAYDKDTDISMSNLLKEEGNKLFQKRDHEGAMLKYEKALKLLPKYHIDVSDLRSNMAACYMQMGLSEYPRAIHECNVALQVTPKYSKALLKRARCYEVLNKLDLALGDVSSVLSMEPNNFMALEVAERIKQALEKKGLKVNDAVIELPPDYVEPIISLPSSKLVKEKSRKKKINKVEGKKDVDKAEKRIEVLNTEQQKIVEQHTDKEKIKEMTEEKAEVKNVDEKSGHIKEGMSKKTVKLVFGEDIRWAQLPADCTLLQLREIVRHRFPSSRAVLIKYKDQEGDLITITTNEELRWAEESAGSQGSVRFYIVQVDPEQDPFFEKSKNEDGLNEHQNYVAENGDVNGKEIVQTSCIEDWILLFAQLFKKQVCVESDADLDLHKLGMKLYSEAMEETVTSEEAQGLFDIAGDKFQEMAAFALFNWGNVHMSRARKRVYLIEDSSKELILSQIKSAYDWAQNEYVQTGKRYEEALRMKPDFYEGFLSLGQQQFEQAKLSWYYAISSNADLETWASKEVLPLYNKAEYNMEKGMQMWENCEVHCQRELSKQNSVKLLDPKVGLEALFRDISADEAVTQAGNMRSQINLLWGNMLYERSIVEYKLRLPVWHECLKVAIEKFELAGAASTVIGVMVKNHCSNENAPKGNNVYSYL